MPTGIFIRTQEYRDKQRQAMLRRVNPGKNKSEETKEKIGDASRKSFGESCRNEVYGQYRKSARLRGFEFKLTMEEFERVVVSPCIYCGEQLTNIRFRRKGCGYFKYTGIDRYDNERGYVLDNCVPCCSICNRIKTNMGIETLFGHIVKMLKNSNMWRRTA